MRKHTRIIRGALLIIMMLALVACQTDTTAAPEVEATGGEEMEDTEDAATGEQSDEMAASEDVFTVGFSSFQQGNDWNIQVAEGAKALMAEWGWEVIHTNAEGDTDAQVTALEGFLSSGVDGVIIGGGLAPALEPAIAELNDAGIKVVTIDITSQNAVTNIYPDNYMTTELLAVFAVNRLQAQPGTYVHLTIPGLGWKTVDIRDQVAELVFEIEGWQSDGILDSGLADAVNQSMTAVRSALLANPDLDLVYSSWGMPAVGAARAIREAGMEEDVFVVCTDADRIVLAEMAEPNSPILGVVGQLPTQMGEMAADYLRQALNGEEGIPKITFAPFYFVTNYPEYLPPGVDSLPPEEAWAEIYPNIEFGEVN